MAHYPKSFRLPRGPVAHRNASVVAAYLDVPLERGEAAVTPDVEDRMKAVGVAVAPEPANHGPRLIWFWSKRHRASIDVDLLERALRRKFRWVSPAYKLKGVATPGGIFCARADRILLRADANNSERLEREMARRGLIEHTDVTAHLAGWRYASLPRPRRRSALELALSLRDRASWLDVDLEYIPFRSPTAAEPGDRYYRQQWNMPRIGAPAAWDTTTGNRTVMVAVIDKGCDLGHDDLRHAYVGPGFNANDPTRDGSPVINAASGRADWHGTAVAGVVSAGWDNDFGIAGLAAGCGLLPVALDHGSTVETAVAIRRSSTEGARVLILSWSVGSFWFETHTRAAIDDAIAMGCVVCAAAGNEDQPVLVLPAAYAPVMACGGSDESDLRWRDPGNGLGSHYADEMRYGAPSGVSVVAPAVNINTTDLTGPEGFTPGTVDLSNYIVGAGTIDAYFGMTSAATPHVAGAAALIRSVHPSMGAAEVRRLIERTAEKVGGYPYADVSGYPHGSRHPEMGYGRLNVGRALDLGDVMIRDWWGDDGVEPSMPPGGNFYSYSDVTIRPSGDDVFDPSTPAASSVVAPGREHTVTARVRNAGPATARDVSCEVRAVPWAGAHFVFPQDWTDEDPLHIRARPLDAPLRSLDPEAEHFFRFALDAAQIDELAGWTDMRWHPCLLAVTRADNDYAFADAPGGSALQTRRNNLAQRNLTVADVDADGVAELPFVIGHPEDKVVRFEVIVGAGEAAIDGKVHLVIDDTGRSFPVLRQHRGLEQRRLRLEHLRGGELVSLDGHRAVRMDRQKMLVALKASRPGRHALHLVVELPTGAAAGEEFLFTVQQRLPDGRFTGGADYLLRVTGPR